VVANIDLKGLKRLRGSLLRRLKDRGALILSGILTEKEGEIRSYFLETKALRLFEGDHREEWTCLTSRSERALGFDHGQVLRSQNPDRKWNPEGRRGKGQAHPKGPPPPGRRRPLCLDGSGKEYEGTLVEEGPSWVSVKVRIPFPLAWIPVSRSSWPRAY